RALAMIRSVYTRVKWATPVSAIIYLVYTLLSIPPASSLDASFDRITFFLPAEAFHLSDGFGSLAIEVGTRLYGHIRRAPAVFILSTALAALMAPWLCMAWIKALDSPSSPIRALRDGAARYLDSIAVTLLHLAGLLVALSLSAALFWCIHRLLVAPH